MLSKVALLAVLQGIAEFLPVSSSGHLVLAEHFLGMKRDGGILLEVALHGGTLLSILIYYRRRILQLIRGLLQRESEALHYTVCVVLGTIPAALVYLLCGDWIEARFSQPLVSALLLCVTGLILLSLRFASVRGALLSRRHAIWIGMAQSFAMLPGISRSGSTIAAGRWLGLSPAAAAEFSFLISIPALGGAMLIQMLHLLRDGGIESSAAVSLGLGFVIAAVVGLISLTLLIRLLARQRFWLFGWYCLTAGVVSGALLLAGV